MCGIIGAFGPDAHLRLDVVEAMNSAQRERGPDHRVVVADGPFVLGNTRLAVQDPTASANQPFCDPDGLFTVVFNGEIYNFRELARQHGLGMRTQCDGEIIPLLCRRRKTGFSVPMPEWIRSGPLRQVVADTARSDAPIWDLLDPTVGRPVLAGPAENPRWSEVWALAALDGWFRRR